MRSVDEEKPALSPAGAAVVRALPHCAMIIDTDRRIRHANAAAVRTFGRAEHELVNAIVCEILHPGNARSPDCVVRRVLDSKEPATQTAAYGGIEGEETCTPVIDETGEVTHLVYVLVPGIRRQASESGSGDASSPYPERLFEKILYAIPDMVSVHDREFRIVFSNWRGFANVPEGRRLLGTKCHAAYRGLDERCPDCEAYKVVETGQARMVQRKVPEGIWVDIRALPLESDGNPELFIEWVRDITNLKQAEEALRESEAKFRGLVESTSDWIWEVDREGSFMYSSPQVARLLGYAPDEVVGRPRSEFMAPAETTRIANRFAECVRTAAPMVGLETVCRHREGHHVVLETNGLPIVDENHQVTGFRGMDRDITDRKEAEAALRASEARFRTITEQSSDVIALTDEVGVITYVSPSSFAVFGIRPAEMLHRHFTDFLHPSSIPLALESFRDSITRHSRIKGLELMMKRERGISFWGELSGSIYNDGTTRGTLAVIRDITERKMAEAELRAREETFRALADNSADIIMRFDREGRHLYVSPAIRSIAGLEPDAVIGKTHEEVGFAPDLCARWVRAIESVFETSRVERVELQLPNGKWIDGLLVPERDDSGAVKAVITSARDISERQQAIQAQQRLVERVQQQQRIVFDLSLHEAFVAGDVDTYARVLTETISESLDLSRVSVWLVEEDIERMRCMYLYERGIGGGYPDLAIDVGAYPAYFSMLEQNRVIDVPDVHADPCMRELVHGYLVPRRIVSLLDATIRSRGRLAGIVCIEQVDEPRSWEPDEISFAGAIADQMAQVLVNAERRRTRAELRASEERLTLALDGADLGTWDWDIPTGHLRFNDRWAEMIGYAPGEIEPDIQWWRELIHPDDRERVARVLQAHLDGIEPHYETEHRLAHKSGAWVWVLDRGRVIERGANGTPRRACGTHLDITERRHAEQEKHRLQDQLSQSQKMESVGRLAGGVAHDFNNLLTGITGNVSLALMDVAADNPLRELLDEIEKSADSAAALTRQLLAFSRKQIVEPKVLDLNEVIDRSQRMLRRLIGEDVTLVFVPGPGLGRVRIDPGQVEQIIVNLAVNARDAMPDGGQLTIETDNAVLDDDLGRQGNQKAGQFVVLSVSDTGCGIDQETRRRIFEPFFTTKDKTKGTGLGLSTVYGAVVQNDGAIEVSSEPGRGTRFEVCFPRVDAAPDLLSQPLGVSLPKGHEAIAVVEDEAMVRSLARRVLERQGYAVRAYSHGQEALSAFEKESSCVDLLITDVVMPGMSGRELAERVQQLRPGIKVLYTSGYTEDAIAHHGVLEAGLSFLPKPYSPRVLAIKVRRLLDT